MKATLETPLTRFLRPALVWLDGSESTTVETTPARADLGDPPAQHGVVRAPCVGSSSSGGLRALPDGGIRATEAALGDVEIAVRAECEPARIVEAGREDGNLRGGLLRRAWRVVLA